VIKKRLQEKNDTLEQRLLTGEVEENNKMEQLREKLHEKELEAEKMRVKLEQSESSEEKEKKPEATPWELFKNWLFKPQ